MSCNLFMKSPSNILLQLEYKVPKHASSINVTHQSELLLIPLPTPYNNVIAVALLYHLGLNLLLAATYLSANDGYGTFIII